MVSMDDVDFKTKVEKRGRITIPSYVRELYEIEEDDFIAVKVEKIKSGKVAKPSAVIDS
jgi:AbrB family looped-hinge helix DNA binding protein